MKILVVSLLRVGDLLMSAPALRDLRHRHPGAKIHVLVNSQSLRAMPLIPSIDKVFSFEREDIQKSLGEVDRPFFEAFDRTSALIDQLNAEGYDLAINLTHTRLSGYLMSLIDAKTKNGLTIDAQMKPSFGSHWFKFLNEQVDLESSEAFHFNDVFRYGMDLGEISSRGPSLLVTEAGRAEAKAIFADAGVVGPVISIQALTSDEKKDWPLASYETSIQGIASRHPEVSFAILAAPFEVERLNPFVERLVKAGLKAFLAKSSLEGAAGILEKSSLLLTGDTSIKHLASGIGTPIVEIVLGGSDASRTGAYRHGSIVVRSREACAP
ncbi:MAG: glycosyltransferase family 9 protein, partial [Bdellovibrionota bacterium]